MLSPFTLALSALVARFESRGADPAPIFDLATLIATADGRVDRSELSALTDSIAAVFGARLSDAMVRHLINQSAAALAASGPAARARTLAAALTAVDAVDEGLAFALAVAATSDGVHPAERAAIDALALAAGRDPAHVDALSRRFTAAG